MAKSRFQPMNEVQANILIAELGLVAVASVMAIGGTLTSWFKLKRKAVEVIEQFT
jgi:hypothetical protein